MAGLNLQSINRELSRLGQLEGRKVLPVEKFRVNDEGQVMVARADNGPIGINEYGRIRSYLSENLGQKDFCQFNFEKI